MSDSSASSAPRNAGQIKKALVDAGFEVFRSRGDEIVLAERPRENLIMDSGVRLKVGDPFEVCVVFRAQRGDYPNDDEKHLFERIRAHATRLLPAGFAERTTSSTRVTDPGNAERTLDTFYEIAYTKSVPVFADAEVELKAALTLEKRV